MTRLLENGGDIYCVNSVANTVFHFCEKYNLVDMFKHLVSFCTELLGADKLDDLMMYRNKEEIVCLQHATHRQQIHAIGMPTKSMKTSHIPMTDNISWIINILSLDSIISPVNTFFTLSLSCHSMKLVIICGAST